MKLQLCYSDFFPNNPKGKTQRMMLISMVNICATELPILKTAGNIFGQVMHPACNTTEKVLSSLARIFLVNSHEQNTSNMHI